VLPHLNREWRVELFQAPVEAPASCLFGGLCVPCSAYEQRKRLLHVTGEPYVPCAGLFGRCFSEPCDENFLCAEVACCPQMAASANRFMMQTRFGLRNTQCDDALMQATACIWCCVNLMQCFRCLVRTAKDFGQDVGGLDECAGELPVEEMRLVADCLFVCIHGCMYAQQKVELDDFEGDEHRAYSGPPRGVLESVPPKMKVMMENGRIVRRAPEQNRMF